MRSLFAAIGLVAVASVGAIAPSAWAAAKAPPPYVSRAEAVKILVQETPVLKTRLEAFKLHLPPIALYLDVPQSNALAPYLEAAFEQGIIIGNASRVFRPTEPITGAELVVLHARMLALSDSEASSGIAQSRTDPVWYERALRMLQAKQIDTPAVDHLSKPVPRELVGRMTAKTLAYSKNATSPTVAVSSPTPVTVASSVAPVSAPAVPHFLPTRLNPITTPAAQPQTALPGIPVVSNGQQITNPVVTTAQIVATTGSQQGGVSIDAGRSQGTVASATTDQSFTQVLQHAQAATIDAGGTGEGMIDAGGNSFTITIPSLGIGPITVTNPEDPFSHGGLLAPLQQGLGHLFGNPGGGGKILVYGHSSSYPWDTSDYTKIFRRINELEPGDQVLIDYNGQQYKYEVSYEEAVPANDMTAYQDDGSGEDLILYTCWPPDSISQRYLVHARPV